MAKIDKSVKIKNLKTGLKSSIVPSQAKGNEGNVGKWYETQLKENGFPMNSKHGIDIPDLGLEVKTRKLGSKAHHTTGNMTYNNIVNTPYKESTIFQKLQQQNRMEYDNDLNTIVEETVYDFRDPEIQKKIEESYENGRRLLREAGGVVEGTVVGGEYGVFEYKEGNSYAHRIPDSGMRKLKGMSKSVVNDIFKFE